MTDYRKGVVYVAQGKDYFDLALQSLRTLRQSNPTLSAAIFTDQDQNGSRFDVTLPIPKTFKRAKLSGMLASPFDRTLFLDCDTLVLNDVSTAFDVLERFDMALCHDVRRSSKLVRKRTSDDSPKGFIQHNSGVIAFNASDKVSDFLRRWGTAYDTAGHARDQVTLLDCLWETDIRFWVLPEEWNFRRLTLLDAWEPLDAVPVIIHSHQLLRHLRSGNTQVSNTSELLELERAAKCAEWEAVWQKAPHLRSLPIEVQLAYVRDNQDHLFD